MGTSWATLGLHRSPSKPSCASRLFSRTCSLCTRRNISWVTDSAPPPLPGSCRSGDETKKAERHHHGDVPLGRSPLGQGTAANPGWTLWDLVSKESEARLDLS